MTGYSPLIPLAGQAPRIAEGAWIAPTAAVIGAVTIGEGTGVFYGAVVRGDSGTISIGERSNLQDAVVVHADPGFACSIGSGVSVGHGAVVHGCTVEDDCLIGMGAVVLNGATVGRGSMLAAGAVVLEGARIPPGSLVAGVPGKVRRELSDSERAAIRENARHYNELTAAHREVHRSGS